ncbi:MAG: hypothetical protein JWP31_1266 [Aeromicrobium sp.]|nr:hypothetical protein [Aeromicrobium sp.]
MTSTDATPAGPGQRRARRPRRSWRRVLVGLAVFALVVGIAGAGAYWKLQGNLTSEELPPSIINQSAEGATNILFLGSDSRDLKTSEYGAAGSGRRSDAMLLVHLAAGNKRIDAVQIPRDTVMDLPACDDTGSGSFAGGQGQVNSALEYGPACSVKTIETLSDVHVDHFVELDFEGFASMVDALAGVPVCLNEPLVDPLAKLDLPAGEQTLSGKDALAYARTRHAIGDGSDIGRLGHQQVVMSAIVDRARSAGVLTRPDRLFRFLNALTSSMTVDEGIGSIPKLTGLAKRARNVPESKITFVTMPWMAAPDDPNRVVPSEDAATVFDAVQTDREIPIEGKTSTGQSTVRTAPVRIVNAARTPGRAKSALTELTNLEYTLSDLAVAEQHAATTRIFYDGTDEALKTAQALRKDFGLEAELVEQDSATMSGVWLILGSDVATTGLTPDRREAPVKVTSRTADESICS